MVDLLLKWLLNIFKRAHKSAISAINSCYDIDIVDNRFESLRLYWVIILARYEGESESISDYDEQWISKIQESYESTEILRHQYNRSRLSERNLCKQNESRSIETQLLEEYKEILETMVLDFDGTDNSKKVMIGIYNEYKQQLKSLQNAQIEYMCGLRSSTNSDDLIREGESWLDEVLCGFRKIIEEVRKIIYGGHGQEISSESKCRLKLEKMRLPSFNGNIRDYPRFRSDFDNYVLPKVDPKDVPFVLKDCFTGQHTR